MTTRFAPSRQVANVGLVAMLALVGLAGCSSHRLTLRLNATSAVAKVDRGTSAKWDATGTQSVKGPVKCSLASVRRNLAP